jgi:aarF domain-containing kinase
VIDLCLRELFVFREMQTDPNRSNFLWNVKTRQVGDWFSFSAQNKKTLIHEADRIGRLCYSAAFIDNWLRLLLAAAQQDREGCLRWSLKLGYLTGEEDNVGRCIYYFLHF